MSAGALVLLCAVLVASVTAQVHFDQKTTFEVKERREQGPFDFRNTQQQASIRHDFVGGKNWEAGAFVTHQWNNHPAMPRQNTMAGLGATWRFRK